MSSIGLDKLYKVTSSTKKTIFILLYIYIYIFLYFCLISLDGLPLFGWQEYVLIVFDKKYKPIIDMDFVKRLQEFTILDGFPLSRLQVCW